jgi:hypothetical protein
VTRKGTQTTDFAGDDEAATDGDLGGCERSLSSERPEDAAVPGHSRKGGREGIRMGSGLFRGCVRCSVKVSKKCDDEAATDGGCRAATRRGRDGRCLWGSPSTGARRTRVLDLV